MQYKGNIVKFFEEVVMRLSQTLNDAVIVALVGELTKYIIHCNKPRSCISIFICEHKE